MSHYTVKAEHAGKWWVLQADEAPGAISQVSRLSDASMIKEAIAFVTGEPEDEIDITVVPVLPEGVRERIDASARLREEAQAANRRSAEEIRAAARALAREKVTLRDIGTILDVSYQRAHQLVKS